MNAPPAAWRADIDGLRAVAVVAVVLFHAGVPGFSGGFVGVDVFFVISGYLVVGLIQRELEAGTFSMKAFLGRRIKRLLPAVAAMLTVTTLLALPLLTPPSLLAFSRSVAMTGFSLANVHFWQTADYFAEAAEFLPLLHMWSLAVEEQFYLVTPLLALAVARLSRGAVLPWHRALIVALTIASLAFSTWSIGWVPTSTFFLLPARYWELGVGAALALTPALAPRRAGVATIVAVAGLVTILVTIVGYDAEVRFPGPAALPPVLGAAAVVVAGRHTIGPAGRGLGHPLLVWIGQRSYALYLWHWPLLALARHALLRPLRPAEVAVVVVVAVVVAALGYRLVEQPCRTSPTLPPFRFALATALCGAALWQGVVAFDGLPGRFAHTAPPAWSKPGEVDHGETCSLDTTRSDVAWGDEACVLTRGGPTRVLLWGDSLAGHYRYGFKSSTTTPATVWQHTTTVCPPIAGWQVTSRPACPAFNQRALALIEAGRFDVVVVAARWEYVFMRQGAAREIRSTLERLLKTGVQVVVVGQTPIFPIDVRALFLRSAPDTPSSAAGTTAHARINAKLRAALPDGVLFVDPATALCDGEQCRYRDGGAFLFHDPAHLSGAGSVVVVEGALVPALQRHLASPAPVPPP